LPLFASIRFVGHPQARERTGTEYRAGTAGSTTDAQTEYMIVSGSVQFPPGPAALTVGILHVSVRTIAPADAPDTELAHLAVHGVRVPAGGATVRFEVPVDLPAGTEVAVRAHADVAAAGRVQVGDLVSTARHLFPRPNLVLPLERIE